MHRIFGRAYEIYEVLGSKRSYFLPISIYYFLATLLELLSLGLLGPYVAIVLNGGSIPEKLSKEVFIQNFMVDKVSAITILSVLLLLIFIIKGSLTVYSNVKIVYFAMEVLAHNRIKLFRIYHSQKFDKILATNSSYYTNMIFTMSYEFSINILLPMIRMLGDMFIGLAILAFLAYINPVALSILLCICVVSLISYFKLGGSKIQKLGENANGAQTQTTRYLNEFAGGFKEIRVMGAAGYFANKIAQESEIYRRNHALAQIISVIPRQLFEVVIVAYIVALALYGISTNLSAPEIASTLAIFALASLRLIPVINSVSFGLSHISYGTNILETLKYELRDDHIRSGNTFDGGEVVSTEPMSREWSTICVDDVSYRYPGNGIDSINNISFKIEKGELVLLVGQSGAGKTTLVDLLLGILTPTQGKISIDGFDVRQNIDNWQHRISYMPQFPFMLDESIWVNIALQQNRSDVDWNAVTRAVEQAQLSQFISGLPNKLDTRVGEMGTGVSGGQKQRIAFARCFYKDADIIIIDEGTSALDHATDVEINKIIAEHKGKKTIIIISHKDSLAPFADSIYALENGTIAKIK